MDRRTMPNFFLNIGSQLSSVGLIDRITKKEIIVNWEYGFGPKDHPNSLPYICKNPKFPRQWNEKKKGEFIM